MSALNRAPPRHPDPARTAGPVLAATDLTETSDASLVTAATLGRAGGVPVHVVHCLKRPGPFGWWDEEGAGRRLDEARQRVREQIARACGSGWEPATEDVTVGRPASEIVARARAVGADVIVLGPGRSRLPGASLLGGTADRVVRTSHGPCLLANRPLRAPPRTVLLATDFSPSALRARDVIVDWLTGPLGQTAVAGGAVRLVMLCVSAFADRPDPPRSPATLLHAEADAVEARLRDAGVTLEPVVFSAPLVVEGIERVARDRDADLVVVGTHGYHPASRMLVGSVATAVAATVDRPILVVPPDQDSEG
jgi:nucleotide-binding universal stress UspA family protein